MQHVDDVDDVVVGLGCGMLYVYRICVYTTWVTLCVVFHACVGCVSVSCHVDMNTLGYVCVSLV